MRVGKLIIKKQYSCVTLGSKIKGKTNRCFDLTRSSLAETCRSQKNESQCYSGCRNLFFFFSVSCFFCILEIWEQMKCRHQLADARVPALLGLSVGDEHLTTVCVREEPRPDWKQTQTLFYTTVFLSTSTWKMMQWDMSSMRMEWNWRGRESVSKDFLFEELQYERNTLWVFPK